MKINVSIFGLQSEAVLRRLAGRLPEVVEGLEPVEEARWAPTLELGEVVGVAVDGRGDPVILHRGGRVWTPMSVYNS